MTVGRLLLATATAAAALILWHDNFRICEAFHASSPSRPQPLNIHTTLRERASDSVFASEQEKEIIGSDLFSYRYKAFNLTYRKKGNVSTAPSSTNILLVHPIGIGLASWFWVPFMDSLSASAGWRPPTLSNTEEVNVFAPNLIGCGLSEGSDAWNPEERGLFIPLDWARGCEALMDHVEGQVDKDGSNAIQRLSNWIVVAQGGLAPIGVLLASRNPQRVQHLILTSPPTWQVMTTAIPEREHARNYRFLRSKIWGNLAFKLLESRGAVEVFSNQFLFSEKCSNAWLDNIQREFQLGGLAARPPVQVFNAGFCMNQSYTEELTTLEQPTLIVQGEGDTRQREEYARHMKKCRIEKLPGGKNCLPWEQPQILANLVLTFVS